MDEIASQQLACFDSYAEQQRRRVEEARARIAEIDSHSTARMHDWVAAHGSNTSFDEYLAEAHASRSRAVAELRSADPMGMGGPSFLATELSRQLSGGKYREIQARVEFDSLRVKAQMRALADFTDRYQNQMAVAAAWASKYGAVAAVTKRLANLPHWPSLANASAMLNSLGVNAAALSSMGHAFEALSARGALKEASIAALGLGSHGPAILRLPRASGLDDVRDAGERRVEQVRQTARDVRTVPMRDEPIAISVKRTAMATNAMQQVRTRRSLEPLLELERQGVISAQEFAQAKDQLLRELLSETSACTSSTDETPALASGPAHGFAGDQAADLAARQTGQAKTEAARAARNKWEPILARMRRDRAKGNNLSSNGYVSSLASDHSVTTTYVRDLRTWVIDPQSAVRKRVVADMGKGKDVCGSAYIRELSARSALSETQVREVVEESSSPA
ncbi:hypothetical protein [Cupriavidus basilensis]